MCFKEAFPGVSDLALVVERCYVELRFINSRKMCSLSLPLCYSLVEVKERTEGWDKA